MMNRGGRLTGGRVAELQRWEPMMDMLLRSPGRGNDLEDSRAASLPLPQVEGKFLLVDGRRFWAKGVTYGSFRANDHGEPFPPFAQLLDDFAQMRDAGINV